MNDHDRTGTPSPIEGLRAAWDAVAEAMYEAVKDEDAPTWEQVTDENVRDLYALRATAVVPILNGFRPIESAAVAAWEASRLPGANDVWLEIDEDLRDRYRAMTRVAAEHLTRSRLRTPPGGDRPPEVPSEAIAAVARARFGLTTDEAVEFFLEQPLLVESIRADLSAAAPYLRGGTPAGAGARVVDTAAVPPGASITDPAVDAAAHAWWALERPDVPWDSSGSWVPGIPPGYDSQTIGARMRRQTHITDGTRVLLRAAIPFIGEALAGTPLSDAEVIAVAAAWFEYETGEAFGRRVNHGTAEKERRQVAVARARAMLVAALPHLRGRVPSAPTAEELDVARAKVADLRARTAAVPEAERVGLTSDKFAGPIGKPEPSTETP